MQFIRTSILSGGILLGLFGVAVADSDWQNVTLDNNPRFTIDVPSVVGKDYLPTEKSAKGDLMFFVLTSEGSGDMYCLLSRNGYSKKIIRKDTIARLASSVRTALCGADDTSQTIESLSLTSNGYPAGTCTVAHTISGADKPGAVTSVLAIAASHAFYMLTCQVSGEDQDAAHDYWEQQWADMAIHVRDSLHLPDNAR